MGHESPANDTHFRCESSSVTIFWEEETHDSLAYVEWHCKLLKSSVRFLFFVLLKELSSLGGPWTFREGLQIFLFHLSKNRRIVQIEFFPVQEFYREFRRATSFDKSFRFPRRVLQVLPAKVLLSIFGSLQFKVIRETTNFRERTRRYVNKP